MRYVFEPRKAVVERIDSSLNYLGALNPSSVHVNKVERDGRSYTLKYAKEAFGWGIDHISREREVLLRAGDVLGITHLVQDYEGVEGVGAAILKEFYEGRMVREDETPMVYNTQLKKQLTQTVSALHSRGIFSVDLHSANVVISADFSEACIIDLGTCVFAEDFKYTSLDDVKHHDMKDIDTLFRRCRLSF
jgi:serine/threonine protein kinase